MPLPKEEEPYNWSDYLAWPEGKRYELIDGVSYAMSPAPFDVKLSIDEDDDAPTVVQPDITVTCDRSKLTEQGMTGPPDLVVDIVSPDSGLIGRIGSEAPLPARPGIQSRKFALYERFGVSEYWIVDQDEQVVEVWQLGNDRSYRRSGVFGPEDTVTAARVPDLVVSLAEVFAEEG